MIKKYYKFVIPAIIIMAIFGVYKIEYYISHKDYIELAQKSPQIRLNDFFQKSAISAVQKEINNKKYIVIFKDGRKKLEFEAVNISPYKMMWYEGVDYAIFMTPSKFIQPGTSNVYSNISIVDLYDFSIKNILAANENTSYELRLNDSKIAIIERVIYVDKEGSSEYAKKIESIDSLKAYMCDNINNCNFSMNENL